MDHEEKNLSRLNLLGILFSLIKIARRFWILALILAGLGAGIAGLYAFQSYTPVYEASMSFTVKVANPLHAGVRAYNTKAAEQMAKTFPYIITSPVLQQKVKDHLGTTSIPRVSATVLEKSNIFCLTVRDADPERAYEVLNAVVDCYPEVADFVVGPTDLIPLNESGIPDKPINEFRPMYAIGIGAIIGLAIWITFSVLLTVTRTPVRDEEQLKQLLNQPCLGQIPVTKVVGKDLVCPLVHKDRGKYGFGEAIRLLQIRVEKELIRTGKRVMIVSSAIPGEGKTTVSVNLAIALARNGKRVLLIDCDMYNPSVSKALKSAMGKVLGNFTFGKTEKLAAVHALSIKNLFAVLLSEGKGVSGRFLSSEDLKQLVESSRKGFDFVILDTPPCSLLADTAEMSEAADCALMVVRQDYASRDQILDGARLLSDSGLPLIGCVMNGIINELSSDGYHYGYGYGYGRGYGYGSGYGGGYGSGKSKS